MKVVVTNDDWRDDDPAEIYRMRMAGRGSFTVEDAARDGKNLSTALSAPRSDTFARVPRCDSIVRYHPAA